MTCCVSLVLTDGDLIISVFLIKQESQIDVRTVELQASPFDFYICKLLLAATVVYPCLSL